MNETSTTITLHEIALKMNVDSDVAARHLKKLGAYRFKIAIETRPPQFKRSPILELLKSIGY